MGSALTVQMVTVACIALVSSLLRLYGDRLLWRIPASYARADSKKRRVRPSSIQDGGFFALEITIKK